MHILKPFIEIATKTFKGPINRTINRIASETSKAIAKSLKESETRFAEIKLEDDASKDARMIQHSIKEGLKSASKVASSAAAEDKPLKELINDCIAALSEWQESDSRSDINLSELSATLRSAVTAIRSARDNLAIPLLNELRQKKVKDVKTALQHVLPELTTVNLEAQLDKIKFDKSEEGRMIKELLVIIINAVSEAKKSIIEELKKVGLSSIFTKKTKPKK